MKVELHIEHQNGQSMMHSASLPLLIGKDIEGLCLKGWRVARQHAVLFEQESNVMLRDEGSLHGTWVAGKRIAQYGPLEKGSVFFIGAYKLVVHSTLCQSTTLPTPQPIAVLPLGQPQQLEPYSSDAVITEPAPASITVETFQGQAGATLKLLATLCERQQLLAPYVQQYQSRLMDSLDLRRKRNSHHSAQVLRHEAEQCLQQLLEQDKSLPPQLCSNALKKAILDEALGLGLLEELLRQTAVSEIMVNSNQELFVEIAGKCYPISYAFSSEAALRTVIDRIVAPLGRRVDEASPMVDARLADGSRVNVVLPPIALKGPTLTIRKFPSTRLTLSALVQQQSLSRPMAELLTLYVQHKQNIVVSGGTGSGKTTLLNVLATAIAPHERVITIEDAAELQLHHPNLVSLETRPANIEGEGAVSIRDLVRNALRMRPDRIVVGECRGAEAFDMLSAMNTGHAGSLTTLHANSPREALNRLETLVLLAGMDLPLSVAREHIANSIEVVVQLKRLPDGRRVISSITEVVGVEGQQIQLQEVFAYQDASDSYHPRGVFPHAFATQPQLVQHISFSN